MPLPVQQFPALTPGQMSPFHEAMQTGMANYGKNITNAYMPYKMEADIMAKQAFANNSQRQYAAMILSNPNLLANMNQDQINILLNQVTAKGITPGGMFNQPSTGLGGIVDRIKQGLSPSQPTQASGGVSNQEFGANNEASPDEVQNVIDNGNGSDGAQPTTAGRMITNANITSSVKPTTGTKNAGVVYTDPVTGQPMSSATTSTASNVQSSMMATQRVAPYLKDLAVQYDKSYGLANNVRSGVESAASWVTGGRVNTPHASAKQQYDSNLVVAADGLLKEFNLNNTTGNRESMENALKHAPGENPRNYEKRMATFYQTMKERDEAGREILLNGINLNPERARTPEGFAELSKNAALADGISKQDPEGSWPRNRKPINENGNSDRRPPRGNVWMIRPDGMQVPVHKSNISRAKSEFKYRDL